MKMQVSIVKNIPALCLIIVANLIRWLWWDNKEVTGKSVNICPRCREHCNNCSQMNSFCIQYCRPIDVFMFLFLLICKHY